MIKLEIGDELTIAHNIISSSGNFLFTEGEKVTIRGIEKREARYSYAFSKFIPEEIWGIKLEENYGIVFLSAFKETQDEQE